MIQDKQVLNDLRSRLARDKLLAPWITIEVASFKMDESTRVEVCRAIEAVGTGRTNIHQPVLARWNKNQLQVSRFVWNSLTPTQRDDLRAFANKLLRAIRHG